MIDHVRSETYALIFLRLADPDEVIPTSLLEALREHPALIVTSPYPQHLFDHLDVHPLDFLTEPYSFERFASSMDKYVQRFG